MAADQVVQTCDFSLIVDKDQVFVSDSLVGQIFYEDLPFLLGVLTA